MKTEAGPAKLRELIRSGKWTTPASGSAPGYVQANLVMVPAAETAVRVVAVVVGLPTAYLSARTWRP